MKNAFYFTLYVFLFSRYVIFCLLSSLLDDVEKRVHEKGKINFKMYNVTTWETNNCNTLAAQYPKK